VIDALPGTKGGSPRVVPDETKLAITNRASRGSATSKTFGATRHCSLLSILSSSFVDHPCSPVALHRLVRLSSMQSKTTRSPAQLDEGSRRASKMVTETIRRFTVLESRPLLDARLRLARCCTRSCSCRDLWDLAVEVAHAPPAWHGSGCRSRCSARWLGFSRPRARSSASSGKRECTASNDQNHAASRKRPHWAWAEIVKTRSRCSHRRWFSGARVCDVSVNAKAPASIARGQTRSSRQGCLTATVPPILAIILNGTIAAGIAVLLH
jgi:hypothetical protein